MAVPLDTNVVSELLRPSPNPAVEGWVGDREAAELHFSAVGEAELRYGVAVLPAGRRRDAPRFIFHRTDTSHVGILTVLLPTVSPKAALRHVGQEGDGLWDRPAVGGI